MYVLNDVKLELRVSTYYKKQPLDKRWASKLCGFILSWWGSRSTLSSPPSFKPASVLETYLSSKLNATTFFFVSTISRQDIAKFRDHQTTRNNGVEAYRSTAWFTHRHSVISLSWAAEHAKLLQKLSKLLMVFSTSGFRKVWFEH